MKPRFCHNFRLVLALPITWLFGTALVAGCMTSTVLRVSDGRAYSERPIDARAYAAFARGRIEESQGAVDSAVQEYHRVLQYDSRAAQAWVRLGALYCQSNAPQAENAWQRAIDLDPNSWQVWFERARCALTSHQLKLADSFAREALRLGPSRPEVTLLSAAVASQLRDPGREATLLFGAVALQPNHAQFWSAIGSSPTLPNAYRRYAAQQYAKLRPLDAAWIPPAHVHHAHSTPSQASTTERLSSEFEQALSRRDASEARRIAVLLGIRPNQLANEALAWGFHSLATEQAKSLLSVDPDDASAWVVAILAEDLSSNSHALHELLDHLPRRMTQIDAGLLAAFLELVQRRTALAGDE